MLSALDVAKYVIEKCRKLGRPISNLQLQKILYYIQGFFLAVYDRALFSEPIYAWKLGPVVPEVYHEYNYFGADPILNGDESFDLNGRLSSDAIELIDAVIDNKSRKTAWQLVDDTHKEDPWKYARQSDIIDINSIRSYFSNHLQG